MDEQLMSWATTRPEVTVQPPGISASVRAVCSGTLRSLIFLLCFAGLAGRREERGVPVGQRALWAAGGCRNQPHDSNAGTLSFTDPTGGPQVSPRTCLPSCVCAFPSFFFFLCLCVLFFFPHVWSRLYVDRIAPSCSSPTGRSWLWARASTADWARGILMTSISPRSFLHFKVPCQVGTSQLFPIL